MTTQKIVSFRKDVFQPYNGNWQASLFVKAKLTGA
jgi:hypothetical protein